MEILLVARDTSITRTVIEMLASNTSWSITKTSRIDTIDDVTAVESSEDGYYDLIISNLSDFTRSPIQVISKITDHSPSTYLLVLYSYSQEPLIEPMLEAGANGYLQNGVSEDELLKAVKTLLDGEQYIGVESTY